MGFRELEIGQKLGEGGFGFVRLVRHRVSKALYAVKSMEKRRIRHISEPRNFELLERERRTLQLLGNLKVTGLTRLVCAGHDSAWLKICMPAFLGGDLSGLLEAVASLAREVTKWGPACDARLTRIFGFRTTRREPLPDEQQQQSGSWAYA